jgi:hypothetical protein
VLPVVDPALPVASWFCRWLVLETLGLFWLSELEVPLVACARPTVLASTIVPKINKPFLIRLLVVPLSCGPVDWIARSGWCLDTGAALVVCPVRSEKQSCAI